MRELKTDYQIYEDANQQWRWRAVASENGQILASGEAYVDRRDAEKVVARLSGQRSSEDYRFHLAHDAVVDAEGNDCA